MYGYVIDLFLKTCLHNINRYTQITFGVCFRKGQKSLGIHFVYSQNLNQTSITLESM